jgi:hypothetical protein
VWQLRDPGKRDDLEGDDFGGAKTPHVDDHGAQTSPLIDTEMLFQGDGAAWEASGDDEIPF